MWALTTTIYATLVFLIGVNVIIAIILYNCLMAAHQYKKKQEELLKTIEIRTKNQYNKIATLPPVELTNYLAIVFSQFLELEASTRVSSADPNKTTTLYASASTSLHRYLGEETLRAISYYYGKDFITNWSELSYRMLEKRGEIHQMIEGNSRAEDIYSKFEK